MTDPAPRRKPTAKSTPVLRVIPTGDQIVQAAISSMEGLYDDCNTLRDGWKMPLEIARHLQGAMLAHDIELGAAMPDSVLDAFLKRIAAFDGGDRLEGDELAEEVCRLWPDVELPYGCADPFDAALTRAQTIPPVAIPTGLFRIRSIESKAAVLMGIARELAERGDGTFYFSTRKIGEALGVNSKTAGQMIRTLEGAGLLRRCGARTIRSGWEPIPIWRLGELGS